MRPDLTTLEPLIARVVDQAQDRLEEEGRQDDNTDDWMVSHHIVGQLHQQSLVKAIFIQGHLDLGVTDG